MGKSAKKLILVQCGLVIERVLVRIPKGKLFFMSGKLPFFLLCPVWLSGQTNVCVA